MKQLVEQMNFMTVEMQRMKDDITKIRTDKPQERQSRGNTFGGNQSWKRQGCDSCEKKGGSEPCTHCWKCGGENHQSRHCQMKKSSNEKRLDNRGDFLSPKKQTRLPFFATTV